MGGILAVGLADLLIQLRDSRGGGEAQLRIEEAVHPFIPLQRLLGLSGLHQSADQIEVEALLIGVDLDRTPADRNDILPALLRGHQPRRRLH